ncbi:TetR/AcrR family transcriptional regulator [Streptomyces triticirhizae]|uniref:TetR/AcrR family transcriptional regulator n=1 Tax=Streptomyces triticirhizae TaxID=2483353 RepID=A0A3M2KYW2_9ACTN|nr:TetR family transcriptional regulator [Streptomyces triticirhizae]RMI30471.1 TetR/AcrR family transcriptional regulator [Streptomyces triticirhizae]
MSTVPGRRRGRPSLADRPEGEPGTRERILDSARTEFARRGFDLASVRAIARGADVNPALVHHYFGTKEGVFAAAVHAATEAAVRVLTQETPTGPEALGGHFTRVFFSIWENPATRDPLLAVLRSAVNNETAAGIFRAAITEELLARVAGQLPEPDARLRVELAAMQLVGAALGRYVLEIEPLASTDVEILVERLAPVVQHHLTATPGTPPPPA